VQLRRDTRRNALQDFRGQRVELNAFSSADLIAWIEGKLQAHGIAKVIPESDTLETAFRRARELQLFQERAVKIADEVRAEVANEKAPKSLAKQVRALLKEQPAQPWDDAIAAIAAENSAS